MKGFAYNRKEGDTRHIIFIYLTYPRYGYLLLHDLLKREGLVVNKKRMYRLYTKQGLQVRIKPRKKLVRPRLVLDRPTAVNQR